MMGCFDEGHQRFTFDEEHWVVVKYDDHDDYRRRIANLEGTKAVDFVAVRNGGDGDLYWIEVKDFRGYRIQNKRRLPDGELAIEIAEKVRDSIAGVVGAYCTSNDWPTWQPFVRALWRRSRVIRMLVWLEEDNMPRTSARRCNGAQVLTQQLKAKLGWLTKRVFVVSKATGSCPEGVEVADLPGAGQPQ
jgi:hypothetical protein